VFESVVLFLRGVLFNVNVGTNGSVDVVVFLFKFKLNKLPFLWSPIRIVGVDIWVSLLSTLLSVGGVGGVFSCAGVISVVFNVIVDLSITGGGGGGGIKFTSLEVVNI
jgi:hypothetical protein